MERETVEKIIGEKLKKALGEKAYKAAIDHYFCNTDDEDFPENIWDELQKHDKYDSVSELEGVDVYCEYEDAMIDQLFSYLWEYEHTAYGNMLDAIGMFIEHGGSPEVFAEKQCG